MVLFSSHVSKCLGTYTKSHQLFLGQKSQLKVSPKKVTPTEAKTLSVSLLWTEAWQAHILPLNFTAQLAQSRTTVSAYTRRLQDTHKGRESPCREISLASLRIDSTAGYVRRHSKH